MGRRVARRDSQVGGQRRNWTPRASATSVALRSVAISADGRTGWAVGDGGTILKSVDGGETWTPRTSSTSAALSSVAFNADGRTGGAVGLDAILITSDGGDNWRLLTADQDYRKYPAPWTWIILAASLLTSWLLSRPLSPAEPETPDRSIADEFASDSPIANYGQDQLGRNCIARTISAFLRNNSTEPPLTIAITADWGQGKSSLMNLVREDLERHRYKTVEFNAWHHQKEQHLFAALMQAVREQAIPPLWGFKGARFRRRLFLSRARRQPWWVIGALAFFGLAIGAFAAPKPNPVSAWMLRVVADLPILDALISDDLIKDFPPSVLLIIGALLALPSSFATLKQRGVSPGRLMVSASGAFRVKAFDDQLGFVIDSPWHLGK